ncbi:MAG TPA: hypothetical protein DF613_01540 [Lachnospiraceae bacterium]|nr:hypothetical protein [Lachnospiraceae bacterium]
MCKINRKSLLRYRITAAATAAALLFSANAAMAKDADVSPVKPDKGTTLPAEADKTDVVSVKLPVVAAEEESPFDFILDPCGLVYETDAMRYGGGKVEKDATILFHNKEGKYDFSRNSDRLAVQNQGDVPVVVTVSASVRGLKGIRMAANGDLPDSREPEVYLALVDDRGNERPISADGETSINCELDSGVYSFGLTGACSPNAEWDDLSVHPTVTVTWHVEPVTEGDGEEAEEKAERESLQGENEVRQDVVPGMPQDVSPLDAG